MKRILFAAGAALTLLGGAAWADTISPITFSADLEVGESVTIEKTVVVEKEGTSTALLDVMFLFDTTGSMSGEIAGAKAAAGAILSGLSGFGDLAVGTGTYNDPGFNGVVTDLTTDLTAGAANINAINYIPGSGGDTPEQGNAAVNDAALNATWRPGSNRFIITLGDASFKDNPSDATVVANLTAANASVIGVNFPGADGLTTSVLQLGGSVFNATTDPATIVKAILDGVSGSFSDYSEVTIDDLLAGLPEIDVSVVCKTADIGDCDGDTAKGKYDRSTDRTFTFDVTFKRIAAGDSSFATHALVDGGIVASEKDRFPYGGTAPVPLPAAGWLMIAGLGGLVAARRRRKA